MLRKLLKYDLLSVWKSGWGTLPVMIGCAIAAAAAARILNADNVHVYSSVYPIAILILTVCAFGVVGCSIVIGWLVFTRFYHNFFTDEGYLTFTLPVKRNTLLLSKTISAFICLLTYSLFALGCLCIVLSFGEFDFNLSEEIWNTLKALFKRLGGMMFVYGFELFLILVSGMFYLISLVQFAISFGSAVAKKAKVLASIGIGYAAAVAASFVVPDAYGLYSVNDMTYVIMLLMYALINFTVGLVLYFLTLDRISRRLNLE